ncbi:MAG: hypothetical protein J6S14_20900 [Clostridia bacterium]|nr:hypothetical protein [Clostridia bacterium]
MPLRTLERKAGDTMTVTPNNHTKEGDSHMSTISTQLETLRLIRRLNLALHDPNALDEALRDLERLIAHGETAGNAIDQRKNDTTAETQTAQ